MTSGSAAGWILVAMGNSIRKHQNQTADVAHELFKHGFGEPGKLGVFGYAP